MKKILIAIAYTKFVETECWKSVMKLAKPPDAEAEVRTYARYSVAQARNVMAKDAVSERFDFVFVVDSDQILPADALVKLLAVDADIRCGWTVMNAGRPETNAAVYNARARHFSFYTEDTLPKTVFESDGGGLAVSLINVSLFKEMEYPYFRFIEYPNGDILTEDLNFCLAVKGMGKSIKFDPSVRAGHIKHIVI